MIPRYKERGFDLFQNSPQVLKYLKAKDILEKDYFNHWSPEGVSPWYWLAEVGYAFSYAGENLAVNFFDSQEIARAWMNSSSHEENILNRNFTETGLGLAEGKFNGKEAIYVVQFFAKPAQKLSASLLWLVKTKVFC